MSTVLDIPKDKHQIVEVILKASTLYKCMFVTKEASSTEIAKQFKKVRFSLAILPNIPCFILSASSSIRLVGILTVNSPHCGLGFRIGAS